MRQAREEYEAVKEHIGTVSQSHLGICCHLHETIKPDLRARIMGRIMRASRFKIVNAAGDMGRSFGGHQVSLEQCTVILQNMKWDLPVSDYVRGAGT